MKHIKKYNEEISPIRMDDDERIEYEKNRNLKNNGHFLIVWTESGDEIHFIVMDMSHLPKIEEILGRPKSRTGMLSQEDDNELVQYVIDNKISDDFYQSGTTTDYKFGEYDIKKVLHLSQLGY